jgi:hypothetical protein
MECERCGFEVTRSEAFRVMGRAFCSRDCSRAFQEIRAELLRMAWETIGDERLTAESEVR